MRKEIHLKKDSNLVLTSRPFPSHPPFPAPCPTQRYYAHSLFWFLSQPASHSEIKTLPKAYLPDTCKFDP